MDYNSREEKIEQISKKIEAQVEKYTFDKTEEKVYKNATEEYDSTVLVGECPHCETIISIEIESSTVECPECEKEIELELDDDLQQIPTQKEEE